MRQLEPAHPRRLGPVAVLEVIEIGVAGESVRAGQQCGHRVTQRLQLPRVHALLRMRHLSPLQLAAPADWEPADRGLRAILPTYYALRISRDALYEHMALWYYRRKGWID